MKRFIIAACVLVAAAFALFYITLGLGLYVDMDPGTPPAAVFKTRGRDILRRTGDGEWESFSIRGVDVSSNLPGGSVLDFEPETEDYLRWLEQIRAMGANTIRVYTVMDSSFYEALYAFNTAHDDPLYLLQGLQVSDSANYGAEDVYDEDFLDLLLKNGRAAVDVIHGRKLITLGDTSGAGYYQWDLSPWVIGYLVGHEWDSGNIAYTNESTQHPNAYEGTYFVTGPEASRFEVLMARVMDEITDYESSKYQTQRLISFVNDPSNDPFSYTDLYAARYLKYNQIDAENILPTEELQSGYFASYRLSYFCPDFLEYFTPEQRLELGTELENLDTSDVYHGYIHLLGRYHTMPVVAAGCGFSTSRVPVFQGEGPLTEEQQGEMLLRVWQDTRDAGWAGLFISTWQDVWDRRTWNTSYATFEFKDPLWQDMQTDGQGYGLMAFHLGEEGAAVCTVDGDPSEWSEEDVVLEAGSGSLSMKYDEKYLYFYAEDPAYDPEADALYIPIDTTPQSGSPYCENYDISFERACDFILCIDGRTNSRVVVQERYEILWAMHAYDLAREDAYYELRGLDSPIFRPISVMVQRAEPVPAGTWLPAVTYETGALRCGNADPEAADYDSLADFCFAEHGVEIRIPWQLLNFASPVEMVIHDDYYEHYGVEYIHIDEIYAGLSAASGTDAVITMAPFPLEGWGRDITWHERLKESYYILQKHWTQPGP